MPRPQPRSIPQDQLPPHDIEAEEAVIGSLLLWGTESTDKIFACSAWLSPNDFFREKNGWIYQAMLDCLAEGMAVDQITVAYKLRDQQRLDAIGGPSYLFHCLHAVPTSMHLEYYAKIVLDCSGRRRIIAEAYNPTAPPSPPPLRGPVKGL